MRDRFSGELSTHNSIYMLLEVTIDEFIYSPFRNTRTQVGS